MIERTTVPLLSLAIELLYELLGKEGTLGLVGNSAPTTTGFPTRTDMYFLLEPSESLLIWVTIFVSGHIGSWPGKYFTI